MPPKKKGKKGKKKKKPKEPKHDSGWKKTLENGKWERPLESLPNSDKWPTWGEIRENMFAAIQKLTIIWSTNLGDTFLEELFAVPRPILGHLELRGAGMVTKFVLSPRAAASSINFIDLSCCPLLSFVLIQSDTLQKLTLARCMALKKVLLETKSLKELILTTCTALDTLMVWSDELPALNLLDCKELTILELYCPKLANLEMNELKVVETPKRPKPPILFILQTEDMRKPIPTPEFGYPDAGSKDGVQSTRPIVPRTHLFGF